VVAVAAVVAVLLGREPALVDPVWAAADLAAGRLDPLDVWATSAALATPMTSTASTASPIRRPRCWLRLRCKGIRPA
jgi:hypothetical protein